MSKGKVAIITAAGKGMGAAIAQELHSRGYSLCLMSHSKGVLDLAKNINAEALVGSVTEPGDLEKLVDTTLKKFGRIDAVVNNTGHPAKGELLTISDADWHKGLDLLLLNVIRMARLVTPIMVEQKAGVIVNISTFAAFEPTASFPVSATIRAGLAAFTKIYADQYAANNIRMNNILPGFIGSYDVDSRVLNSIPMKRQGTVAEIAKTVAFLLSQDAGYLTGQNIRVDGGLTRSV